MLKKIFCQSDFKRIMYAFFKNFINYNLLRLLKFLSNARNRPDRIGKKPYRICIFKGTNNQTNSCKSTFIHSEVQTHTPIIIYLISFDLPMLRYIHNLISLYIRKINIYLILVQWLVLQLITVSMKRKIKYPLTFCSNYLPTLIK